MRIINKKGQEEIVGFVLIIVIISVIMLVFLAFSIRKTDKVYTSKEAENFIQSLMKHTTQCEIYGNFEAIEDLIKDCQQGRRCSNNLNSCEELNLTLNEILEKSWDIKDTKYSYYSFSVYYENNGQDIQIMEMSKGNCTGTKVGAEHLISASGKSITARFRICVKRAGE